MHDSGTSGNDLEVSDLACALHVPPHPLSDEAVVSQIAADAAVDVVCFADEYGAEGWYEDVLVLADAELNPHRCEHCFFVRLDDLEALAEWDRLGQTARIVGIAELDGERARTHVQTAATPAGVLDYDRALVLDALRSGHCYMAVDEIAAPTGFMFVAVCGRTVVSMGDEAASGQYTLCAELPTEAELSLLHNGVVMTRSTDDRLTARIDTPGVYRLEARVDGSPWILSNPIYLR